MYYVDSDYDEDMGLNQQRRPRVCKGQFQDELFFRLSTKKISMSYLAEQVYMNNYICFFKSDHRVILFVDIQVLNKTVLDKTVEIAFFLFLELHAINKTLANFKRFLPAPRYVSQ